VATLVDLAPARERRIGSGFTGRLAMGQRPNSWAFVAQYARQLRALLPGDRGGDGAATRLLHGPGRRARAIRVPFLFAVAGPRRRRGRELARHSVGDTTSGFAWSTLMVHGTVLEPGESFDSPA